MKTNISKIIYYGAVQNFLFSAMQQALFAIIGEDDEEKEVERWKRTTNSMIDSILGGIGFGGQVVIALKSAIQEFLKQEKKGWRADHTYTILRFLGLSPTVGSKLRKIYSAIQEYRFNKDIIGKTDLIDNPIFSIIANVVSGIFNIPLDRLIKKIDNVEAAINEDLTTWQRLALLLGWNTWDLDIQEQDILDLREEIKEEKQREKEEKRKKEKEAKEKEQENIFLEEQKQEIEDGKKDITCAAVNKQGERCSMKVDGKGNYCTIHQKVDQRADGKKVQCKQIKSNGDRCKMKTSSKSGLCYYHD
jgi:hypothetical protein